MIFYVIKKLRHDRTNIAKDKLINSTGILMLVGVTYICALVILLPLSLYTLLRTYREKPYRLFFQNGLEF